MVKEVVKLKPDVVFVPSTRLLFMFKEATATIPLVSLMADPIRTGLVTDMARPGGNITGVAIDQGVDLFDKRFELLKQAVPRISKLGVLVSQLHVQKIMRANVGDLAPCSPSALVGQIRQIEEGSVSGSS
jgi:putative ABC transport system substrate-binding protein